MVIVGSARIGENGRITGGASGDQKQITTPDYKGEVSLQYFYESPKGYYVLRAKSDAYANKIAKKMLTACNNPNIGYDQNNRLGVITNGVSTKVKTECDCSSLVRACVKEGTGKDPGNFTTANEAARLEATGLFDPRIPYVKGMILYTGDILVTKTKGHTLIVVEGAHRKTADLQYFDKYGGTTESLVTALETIGENSSFLYRSKIAAANDIVGYKGTAEQNIHMVNLLKRGKLIKPR